MGEDADDYQPSDIEKVNDKYLKQKGVNAHEVKEDALDTNKGLAEYDIYVDKDIGQLWVYRKGGRGIGIPTGEYIK